jgi:hypothetical protein
MNATLMKPLLILLILMITGASSADSLNTLQLADGADSPPPTIDQEFFPQE